MRLKDIHWAADAAGRAAAERCPKTSNHDGFVFIKFLGNTPWGLWTRRYGLAIPSSKKLYGKDSRLTMMIKRYDSSMPKKIAYTYAYAEFLKQKGIDVRIKIDRE